MFDLGYEVHKNHLVLISGAHNRLFSNDKYLYIDGMSDFHYSYR